MTSQNLVSLEERARGEEGVPQRPPGSAPLRGLVVGRDPGLRAAFRLWAAESGVEAVDASRARGADLETAARSADFVLAVLADGPGDDLPDLLRPLQGAAECPHLLISTPRPSLELTLGAARSGAADLIAPEREEFRCAIERIRSARTDRVLPLPQSEGQSVGGCTFVGESAAMRALIRQVALLSLGDATVTIQGASGTGKELVARALHGLGPRSAGPYVAVNCAAIPDHLLESELFGHEKGAFTGAVSRQPGRIRSADHGTLLLDEIADMSPHLQAKILRVLEEREIAPLGGGDPVPVDVRFLAATNSDLEEEVERGRFRRDLYYRLAVVTLALPPLRERGGDVDLLTGYFARRFGERHGKSVAAISERATGLLRAHPWTGNVRELRNVVERAVVLCTGDTIRPEHLPESLQRGASGCADAPAGDGPRPGTFPTLAEVEARHIEAALAHTGGHVGAAAALLGIHRNTMARKLRRRGSGRSPAADVPLAAPAVAPRAGRPVRKQGIPRIGRVAPAASSRRRLQSVLR